MKTITECTNRNRNGDCLTRNAKNLCGYCASTLAPDELRLRAINFIVAGWKRQCQGMPRGCTAVRNEKIWPKVYTGKYRTVELTCIRRRRAAPCSGCLAGMTEARLFKYAAELYDSREEDRRYWSDMEEAKKYTAELRRKGITGIEWNIEFPDEDMGKFWADANSLACAQMKPRRAIPERRILIDGIFAYSKPCFVHGADGLLPAAA
jgi:hypothetical protein